MCQQDMKYLEMVPDENPEQVSASKPLPPPRDTALSQARKVLAHYDIN